MPLELLYLSGYDVYQSTCHRDFDVMWFPCLYNYQFHETYNSSPCTRKQKVWSVWSWANKETDDISGINSYYTIGVTNRNGGFGAPGLPLLGPNKCAADLYRQWTVHFAKFSPLDGHFVWADRDLYVGMDVDFLFRIGELVDDQNRMWGVQYAQLGGNLLFRHKSFEGTSPEDQLYFESAYGVTAISDGMPILGDNFVYVPSDGYGQDLIYTSTFVNYDNTASATFPGFFSYDMPIALSVTGNWIAVIYRDRASYDVPEEDREYRNIIWFHSYTAPRVRTGYVKLCGQPYRAVTPNQATVYVFTTIGTIEVINPITHTHLGILHYKDANYELNFFHGGSQELAVGYDFNRRRLLTFEMVPDACGVDYLDYDNACRMRIEGWMPQEVPEFVTTPIPLQPPIEGNTVTVLSRVYAHRGKGFGGKVVTASVTVGDGSVTQAALTDSNGFARHLWTCGSSGVDVETVEVSHVHVPVDPTQPDNPTSETQDITPTTVLWHQWEDTAFNPGFWIWVPTSQRAGGTLQSVLEPFLSDYDVTQEGDDPYENNFRGVLVEYLYAELETGLVEYDWNRVQTDLDYCKSRGLKFMISVRLSHKVSEPAALPTWLTDNELLTTAPTTCPTRGTFRSYRGEGSGDDACIAVLNGYVGDGTLANSFFTYFSSENDFCGWVPLDPEFYTQADAEQGGVDIAFQMGVMRSLHNNKTINVTARQIIWGYEGHSYEEEHAWETQYPWRAVGQWYPQAETGDITNWGDLALGVGLIQPRFNLDDYNGHGKTIADWMTQWSGKVPTGIMITAEDFSSAHNMNCDSPTPSQASFYELVFGSFNADTGCSKPGADHYRPWYIFVELNAANWNANEESIMPVVSEHRMTMHKDYYR